ncbi:type II secretion system ATPase GspE [Desulfatitalea alkaliphila]|uniref:protein-secreting ATPase n=1 Tax=Desulfatitalea alkaliphila TaxID=2929485 RepID=A0AA41R2P1_9BACT|nr:type II secretion system ATPase GspE [Desulfatitalea alkaliphila]MCJ8500586.1 type II secretion system ATPase GspE [Desulfatitalea alkaliphila]
MPMELAHILKHQFALPEDSLADAQHIQQEKGGRLGDILVQRQVISETQLLEALSVQYGIPFWPELPMENIMGNDFAKRISIQFLKRHHIVPLAVPDPAATEQSDDTPGKQVHIVAINDPANFNAVDDLSRILGLEQYKLVLSSKQAILGVINLAFDLNQDSAAQLVQDMEDESDIISQIEDTADLLDDTSDAPIIKLVNHILSQSIKARASDVHIEPYQDSFKVRYRVDGILYDLLSPPKWIQPALTSRIKVMAKLNIAEKRLPQDGRLEVRIGSQMIDVRVSTLPTTFGERVVMRLLNKSSSIFNLNEIGLSPAQMKIMKELVHSPNGIILVTGPTGSGKTTTLYSVLASINTPDINIITIEDPVEYQLKGISQIQVNPKIELTFARGLRSIVRQDPDVILVGEIRDRETAEIAVQSALTGHLVFSTLHTNDSASAITRLVDIGVEPFLISSSILAVIAQRLVRVLCEHCKESYKPDMALQALGLRPDRLRKYTFYRAKGCDQCFNTGYRGRIGIYEIMIMGQQLKTLVQKTYDAYQIKQEALKHGMVTLRRDGLEKVLRGITTIEEVVRVTQK